MAETSILWETNNTGDGITAGYTDDQLFQLFRSLCPSTNLGGVARGILNALAVSGTATPVAVASGQALVYGIPYFNSASVNVTIPTPAVSTRIDRIVLRASWAAQTVRITRIAGTEGAGAPAMTQTAGTTWDIPLATVSIDTGGVIAVTDVREYLRLMPEASGVFATIAGGLSNTAAGNYATAVGGQSNTASGIYATVGGGRNNTASDEDAVVAGGNSNTASADQATIGGGQVNQVSGLQGTIAGGASNNVSGQDGTIGGGNANVVSAQSAVVAGGVSNQVTAQNGAVGGGTTNVASAVGAAISGGGNNAASGSYSSVPGGLYGSASKYGQRVQAAGRFAAAGDAQHGSYVLRNSTANNTPTELFLDGSSARLTLASDTTYAFSILLVARRTDADGESAAYEFKGCIDNNAGTTALVGSVTKTVLAEDTAGWDADVTADNTNDALILTVTGENAKTIRWVATVWTTEVTG